MNDNEILTELIILMKDYRKQNTLLTQILKELIDEVKKLKK